MKVTIKLWIFSLQYAIIVLSKTIIFGDNMEFKDRLKKLRKEKQVSQQELANSIYKRFDLWLAIED